MTLKVLPLIDSEDYRTKARNLYLMPVFADFIAKYPSEWKEALRDAHQKLLDVSIPKNWEETATADLWYQLYNKFWSLLPDGDFLRWGPFIAMCDLCAQPPNDVKMAAVTSGGLKGALRGVIQKVGNLTLADDPKVMSKKGKQEQ